MYDSVNFFNLSESIGSGIKSPKYEKNLRIEIGIFKNFGDLPNDSAIKETKNIDTIVLYNVKADISLNNKNWLFLNTEKAIFEINKKTLRTDNKIQGYYDDGSSFYSSSMEYNFDNGIAKSEEEIVMFGKWGNIKSKKFSFNSIKDIYRFEDKAVMIVK